MFSAIGHLSWFGSLQIMSNWLKKCRYLSNIKTIYSKVILNSKTSEPMLKGAKDGKYGKYANMPNRYHLIMNNTNTLKVNNLMSMVYFFS